MKKILAFIFLFLSINMYAQEIGKEFSFVNIKEGISKVGVSSIVQGNNGFIWISTLGAGLYKFNGIEYTSYKYKFKDSTSLSSNRIKCSYIDSKNRLWIGTENGLNLYNKDLNNFKRFKFNFKDLNNNDVLSLQEDASNNLLIGTNGSGLFKLNLKSLKITRILNSEENNQQIIINSLIKTKQGKTFAGTNAGLKEVDGLNNKLIATRVFGLKNNSISSSIETLFLDAQNNLWVGSQTDEGIYKCNLSSDRNNNVLNVQNLKFSSKKIMDIVQLKDRTMLVGTENDGLFHLDKNNNVIKNYVSNKTEENSILHNSIWELFLDRDQRIWMGYYNSGVAVYDELYDKFKNIKSLSNKENSLKTPSVMGLVKRGEENLWIATDGGGIDVFNQLTEKITHINSESNSIYSGLTSDYIISLFKDSKGNIWAGSWDNGIYFLKKGEKKFINYNTKNTLGSLASNSIQSFSEDSTGEIWIAAFLGGVQSFNPKTKKFHKYDLGPFFNSNFNNVDVKKIIVDANDNIWVGTSKNGLHLIKREVSIIKEVISYGNLMSKKFNNPSDANYILTIYQDSKKNIWVGTRGAGLCKIDIKNNSIKWFNDENGLKETNVCAIIEDNQNNLWLSGNEGLTKMIISNNSFINYTDDDGLISNDFNINAVFKDLEGIIYFGNFKGVDYFNPKEIKTNTKGPTLSFTGLKLFNKDVELGIEDSPLLKSISEVNNLVLTNKQSVFTIEYTGINFTRPEKNSYAYYLEGYETEWNYVQQKRSATYTNLDQGTYVFKLKASNNDGLWSDKPLELKIIILPPWWRTNWAVFMYILLFILSIIILNYLTKKRIEEKELIKNERIQQFQKDELNNKQIQFFTNISHEFRTPLTLIINPLKDLISNKELLLPLEVKNKHSIIYKNTERLYRLINELMDLRKLENNKMELRAENMNLVRFSKNVLSYFQEEANSKNILLSFDSDLPNLNIVADPKMIEKIIFNLLSNAVKVTPKGGTINLEIISSIENYLLPLVNKNKPVKAVQIIISDTGTGLKEKDVEKIFERFYQVEDQNKTYFGGTGIGLEVVQNFVKLHKGKIEVKSKVGEGTAFKLVLPIGKKLKDQVEEPLSQENDPFKSKKEFLSISNSKFIESINNENDEPKTKTILIIEDNIELRDYLEGELRYQYKVLLASNGLEGVRIAQESLPDLIISDVIMPKMNGFDLCQLIKNDTSTSHIPLLMLTAKASIENRIEGIEMGADAYMVKPFDLKLLKLRISQLIKSRQLIFDKYFSAVSGINENEVSSSTEKDFIQNLLDFINENIDNSNLSVEELASQLNLSRSQLYRKIKAITGQTVSEFIRGIRLEKAKQILERGGLSISETCYKVGFASPSYFSKCFRAKFGVLPTEISSK